MLHALWHAARALLHPHLKTADLQRHINHAAVAVVPIRALAERHRKAVLSHLLELPPEDRYLRFGYAAQDAQIQSYAEGLDFVKDQVFGIFDRRLRLIAVAHLAYSQNSHFETCVEFGVSVLPHARSRGLGSKLFARAQVHATNDRISLMFIHLLSDNSAMLKIARRAGALVERQGSESDACLRLPAPSMHTRVSEMVDDQIAYSDYRLKVQAKQFWEILGDVQEVRRLAQDAQTKVSP